MEDTTITFRCPGMLAEKIRAFVDEGEYMNMSDAGRDLTRIGILVKEGSYRDEKKNELAGIMG